MLRPKTKPETHVQDRVVMACCLLTIASSLGCYSMGSGQPSSHVMEREVWDPGSSLFVPNRPPTAESPVGLSDVAPADTDAQKHIPDYFVGVGGRGLKGDPFATVIGAKLKLTDIGGLSFSTRPEVLLGGFDSPEWRLPFTVEGEVNKYGFAWFGGGGLAYNMDDLGETDAMVTGGINMPLSERWVLNFQINYMWQHAIDDLDGEFIFTLNYGF
jgi:hypothetical protein